MIKPLHDRILVKPIDNSEFSDGGVYQGSPMTTFIANVDKGKQVTVGEVLAVGEGKVTKYGVKRPPETPIGSLVCFSDTCGIPVNHDGEDYLFIREKSVYGYLPDPTSVEHVYRD